MNHGLNRQKRGWRRWGWLPARELENSNPFGLRLIGATQDCQYPTHDGTLGDAGETQAKGQRRRGGERWGASDDRSRSEVASIYRRSGDARNRSCSGPRAASSNHDASLTIVRPHSTDACSTVQMPPRVPGWMGMRYPFDAWLSWSPRAAVRVPRVDRTVPRSRARGVPLRRWFHCDRRWRIRTALIGIDLSMFRRSKFLRYPGERIWIKRLHRTLGWHRNWDSDTLQWRGIIHILSWLIHLIYPLLLSLHFVHRTCRSSASLVSRASEREREVCLHQTKEEGNNTVV